MKFTHRSLKVQTYLGQWQAIQAFDAATNLPDIEAPALVVMGDRDVPVPPENSRFIAPRIPGATLVEIPQAPHCFWIEKPRPTVDAVRGFLEKCG